MVEPERPEKPVARPPDRVTIADLAYRYWQERGCPIGSPEEDWYRAEQGLRERDSP
jgi:hypothetical protein